MYYRFESDLGKLLKKESLTLNSRYKKWQNPSSQEVVLWKWTGSEEGARPGLFEVLGGERF